MNGIVTQILGWVLPIVLGPIVYLFAREVLNATRRIDDLPPIVKRIAVVGLGALVVAVFNVLGVALPPECYTGVDFALTPDCAAAINTPTVVRGLTAGVVAMVLHALKKAKPNG